jgi:hypothetical protein
MPKYKTARNTRRFLAANDDPDHQCRFSARGSRHITYVTDADGHHFKDVTRISRCICGERQIMRISREEVPEIA